MYHASKPPIRLFAVLTSGVVLSDKGVRSAPTTPVRVGAAIPRSAV